MNPVDPVVGPTVATDSGIAGEICAADIEFDEDSVAAVAIEHVVVQHRLNDRGARENVETVGHVVGHLRVADHG